MMMPNYQCHGERQDDLAAMLERHHAPLLQLGRIVSFHRLLRSWDCCWSLDFPFFSESMTGYCAVVQCLPIAAKQTRPGDRCRFRQAYSHRSRRRTCAPLAVAHSVGSTKSRALSDGRGSGLTRVFCVTRAVAAPPVHQPRARGVTFRQV